MKQSIFTRQNRVVSWLLQARRIPLLFAVTVVSGIFYHYAPKLTVVWILLSLVLQSLLFRLFDYVKKHHFLGGIAYLAVGFVFMSISVKMISLGYSTPGFGPDDLNHQLSFFVWFLTPQSVLTADYMGYTWALFSFFTFFIASIAYYFTLLRYRVLMSFTVMVFPFAIYAKENETMPIPSIIILLAAYFAVMMYCRQAHAEDEEIVQIYQPDADSTLKMPKKKSAFFGMIPEILDQTFVQSIGLFLAGATIIVLILPKPEVEADRNYLDAMLDMSAVSDYLMNAISGFTDTSDGTNGNFGNLNFTRTLYYTQADEPLNLRIRTFTNYHYDGDRWTASDYDKQPPESDPRYMEKHYMLTVLDEPNPIQVAQLIQQAARENPSFAEKWNLQAFSEMPISEAAYKKQLLVQSAAYNLSVYPAPNYIEKISVSEDVYQNDSGIVFRYQQNRRTEESYALEYISESFAQSDAAQALLQNCSTETWQDMLEDLLNIHLESGALDEEILRQMVMNTFHAQTYGDSVESQTPMEVQELAVRLTEGLHSDYEKAMAIRDYLRFDGDFIYSLEFEPTMDDNISTFLFDHKTGVCRQFAAAMAELCRAAGLTARYVEGYAMQNPDTRSFGSNWDYAVTTDDGHAFVDVFIAGYGWMMMDATASADNNLLHIKPNVIVALQYSGLILLAAAILAGAILIYVVPVYREKRFRSRYQKQMNAESVTEAFARLRRQWRADPAMTARDLCSEMGAFLEMDFTEFAEDFEKTVYAGRCDAQTAERIFRVYCEARDKWHSAVKRHKREEKAAAKQSGSRRTSGDSQKT